MSLQELGSNDKMISLELFPLFPFSLSMFSFIEKKKQYFPKPKVVESERSDGLFQVEVKEEEHQILMLYAYIKNKQEDLTPKQLKALKKPTLEARGGLKWKKKCLTNCWRVSVKPKQS